MVAAPFGKCPGQSVATCNNVRDIPSQLFGSPILAVARPGLASSTRFNDATSPSCMASTTAMARGLSGEMFNVVLLPIGCPHSSLSVHRAARAGTTTNHQIPDRCDGKPTQSSVDEPHTVVHEIPEPDQTSAHRADDQRPSLPVSPIGRYLADNRQGRHSLNQDRRIRTQERN